ncbi:MAG: hypothetical protein NUV53_02505 [Patescibacteria group bacterium]|nr:hypothetical protein [Patescibacteria group bacterium]
MDVRKKTALISVYHKEGIAEFAGELQKLGWDILASGGTAKHLTDAGIKVRDAAFLVGEPILGHRVVTLSREVHAGLLARDMPEDRAELEKRGIIFIDLVCVDLYPLEEEIAKPNATRESIVEMTDIGGPAMLRSAAKGGRIVVSDPADRMKVIEWLRKNKYEDEGLVRELAAKAEFTVAQYCLMSASYHGGGAYAGVLGHRAAECLYGENAWQKPAALYTNNTNDPLSLDNFTLVEGTPLSYNNWCDTDRLLQTVTHIVAGFEQGFGEVPKIAVAVKHGNPCGAAYGSDSKKVLENMISGDPLAIMGGVVMTNFPVGVMEAETLANFGMKEGNRRLLDTVVAPEFEAAAIELLRRKKDKCRFVANENLSHVGIGLLDIHPRIRYVRGGFLRQPNYVFVPDMKSESIKKYGPVADVVAERNMMFAWAVGSTSNSNTITIVKNGMLLGDGVGQQDRVGAAELAIKRARRGGHDTNGAVAYSDSFFPFPDAPRVLIDAGVRAIFSTSGSVRDKETIALCEQKGISLYLIPDKEGRGFFGH